MFSVEQRRVAIELFIKYDHSYAAVIRELGYPHRHTLKAWWEEYEKTGKIPESKSGAKSKFSDEEKRKPLIIILSTVNALAEQ